MPVVVANLSDRSHATYANCHCACAGDLAAGQPAGGIHKDYLITRLLTKRLYNQLSAHDFTRHGVRGVLLPPGHTMIINKVKLHLC